jgi:hypothetical protein
MSSDAPSADSAPGTVAMLTYTALARAREGADAVARTRDLVRPFLIRCLEQWDLTFLQETKTDQDAAFGEELLNRVCVDLCGTTKFEGSLTTFMTQAAANLERFLEQRTLLITARYFSLPRRRAVVGPERFDRVVRGVAALDDQACVQLDEREELILVAAAQGGNEDAFGRLWKQTRQSMRGAIRGRYFFKDAVVDDLVGDASVRLVKELNSFDVSLSTFRSSARRAIVFAVKEFLRRQEPEPEGWPQESVLEPDWLRVRDFFDHAFRGDAQLHHKLALGLTVLLEYRPREIVSELSDQPFQDLSRRLSEFEGGGATWIRATTAHLDVHLERVPQLRRSTFDQHYTGRKTVESKRANIHHWTNEIKKRTIAEMADTP